MAKTTESTLRIRAENLAKKDLADVAKSIDQISESQKRNATASGLASRALRDLTDEQAHLAQVAAELQKRGGIAGNLIQAREQVAQAAGKVRELVAELNQLKTTKASGAFMGDIDKAIKNVERSVKRANVDLDRQSTRYQKIAESAGKVGITSENAAQSIEHINQELVRTDGLMKDSVAAVERYNGALAETRGILTAQETAQKEITAEADRRTKLEEQAAAARLAGIRKENEARSQQRRLNEQLAAQFTAPPRLAKGQTFGPGGDAGAIEAAKKASAQAAAAAAREAAFHERLNAVLARRGGVLARLAGVQAAATNAVRGSTAALDKNAQSLDRNNKLGGIFADTGRKSLSVYQRLRGQLLSTAAAYVGLFQAVNLVKSAIDTQQKRQGIQIQLLTANHGNTARATRDWEMLRKEGDRLGLVYEDLASHFANFKIGANAAGLTTLQTNDAFIKTAEIVSAMRLSVDDADGVFRAFVQILGKGKVMSEELTQQLGDRLPGAVAMFGQAMVKAGKIDTIQQLPKFLKDGKAGIAEFQKFIAAYNDMVKDQVDASSKTLFAQFNRLKNAYHDFLADFANAGVSSRLLQVVNAIIAKLKSKEGGKFAEDLAKGFEFLGKIILVVIDHSSLMLQLFKGFLALQLTKAVVGIGSSFAITAFKIFQAGRAILAWTAAMGAARIAGEGLTLGMRAMLLLLGPVGLAIGVAAAAWAAYGYEAKKAAADTSVAIGALTRLRTARGQAAVQEIKETGELIKARAKERDILQQRVDEIKKGGAVIKLMDKANNAQDALLGTTTGSIALNRQLETAKSNITTMVQGTRLAAANLRNAANEARALAQADAAEQPTIPQTVEDDLDDKAKKRAEAEAKAADLLAEKRRDIADRAAREVLDIEKALSEARLSIEATTQAQIDANTKEKLDIIDTEIKKKRSELEGLLRDAQRAGSTEGVANANAALAKLPALAEVQRKRVEEDAIVESIRLKEKAINDLIALRDGEIDAINTKVQLGLLSETEGREKVLDAQKAYQDQISTGIDALILQLQSIPPDSDLSTRLGVPKLIQDLNLAKLKAGELQTTVQLVGKNLGGQFASGIGTAMATFAKGLAGGIEGVNGFADSFRAAKDAFLNFLADFLVGIGQAILQAIILEAIMAALEHRAPNYSGAAIGALTGHTGGVVKGSIIGKGNPTRQVSPAIFAGAARFHEGGLPGLKPNEVPAILKKREEVLTEDDPRNVLNGGTAGAAAPNIDLAIHNSIDSGSVISAGVNTRAGRKAIYNHISAEKEQYKRLFGIQ
jgi:tape measure domain-containing protein